MTEPVPSATSPRRTVRVAVALVTGQAVLCAVIGLLTIGGGPGSKTAGRDAEARAPVVVPTASIGLPAAPLPPVPRKSPESHAQPRPEPKRTTRPAAPDRATAKPRPKRSTAPPRTISAPDDATGPESPKQPNGLVPTGSPGNELTAPVREGEKCETEGERGHTTEGEAMRCAKADDGTLSWQPV